MSNNSEEVLYTIEEIKQALQYIAEEHLDVTVREFSLIQREFISHLTETHNDNHIDKLRSIVARD